MTCPRVTNNHGNLEIEIFYGPHTSGWELCAVELHAGKNYVKLDSLSY